MTLLTKSAILGASDLPHEDVSIPEWGGTIRVRVMTGLERDEFRSEIATDGGASIGNFSAALLAATCIDENGERLFSMGDIAAIRAKRATLLDVAAGVAARINGLGGQAAEDASKNSSSGQSDDSGSDSQKNSENP
jgi:hypothetical protein